ncbi:hypothetical protein [Bizionia myxarmorum]|uniref:Competence protein CoiA-like family protein n=1 Tax=Bizionia myxarmorum TaxID=291186 RepID=A0A5D0R6D9_9FLAO|nr:hypothetical protein [Bizionia myxarmorum]TYB76466.1 hypothetical protein ES674_12875 [Bizionia myxarmorum]
MSLEEKQYDIEANNDWAKNVKGEHLYIDSAKSGRQGYFCIGCDKQMDAVIRKKNPKHRSYFRHVPVDISKDETPCTFSNREYRETLATDILQRLKRIKVPAVYKYAPIGKEGDPMLLEKAKFIDAHSVKSQLTFYEDIDGTVKFGKNPDIEARFLLIRPDVIFFDSQGKPILFIELVITHKVNEEKKIKLRRLGIDTVSIIVPKSSEQEIEDNFKTTQRVKWEYNGIEAITKYVRVSSGTSEGVLEFDTDQRRIFEESISCRKARLNNTLRTINKCLRTESYRGAEQHFESEISRIEGATRAETEGLDDMEGRCHAEVYASIAGGYEALKLEKERFKDEENKFSSKGKDLETRYHSKRRELEQEEGDLSRLISEYSELGESTERIRGEFRTQLALGKIDIERDTRTIEGNIVIDTKRREGLSRKFGLLEQQSKERFTRDKSSLEKQSKEIESELNDFAEFTQREERNLQREFEDVGKQSVERIIKRDSIGESELSRRIESVLETGRLSNSFNERLETYERFKRYLKLVRSGTWKKG